MVKLGDWIRVDVPDYDGDRWIGSRSYFGEVTGLHPDTGRVSVKHVDRYGHAVNSARLEWVTLMIPLEDRVGKRD